MLSDANGRVKKWVNTGGLEIPRIVLNGDTGELLLEGKSMPENIMEVYRPVLDWVELYVKNPAASTILSVRLSYYNTSTSKILLTIIELLEGLFRKGHSVVVRWYFEEEDEDMEEAGLDLSVHTLLPFEVKAYRSA